MVVQLSKYIYYYIVRWLHNHRIKHCKVADICHIDFGQKLRLSGSKKFVRCALTVLYSIIIQYNRLVHSLFIRASVKCRLRADIGYGHPHHTIFIYKPPILENSIAHDCYPGKLLQYSLHERYCYPLYITPCKRIELACNHISYCIRNFQFQETSALHMVCKVGLLWREL